MDNHIGVSIFLFSSVNLMAMFTLFLPEWVVSHVGGEVSIGLWKTCVASGKQSSTTTKCFFSPSPVEWQLAILFIVMGCFCDTFTVISLVASLKSPPVAKYGRWFGLATLFCFSIASLLVPLGFSMDQIRGELFQLPSSFYAGQAYILFNMSIWMTAISEVFAIKLFFPNF